MFPESDVRITLSTSFFHYVMSLVCNSNFLGFHYAIYFRYVSPIRILILWLLSCNMYIMGFPFDLIVLVYDNISIFTRWRMHVLRGNFIGDAYVIDVNIIPSSIDVLMLDLVLTNPLDVPCCLLCFHHEKTFPIDMSIVF